jgi:hypothetical protein
MGCDETVKLEMPQCHRRWIQYISTWWRCCPIANGSVRSRKPNVVIYFTVCLHVSQALLVEPCTRDQSSTITSLSALSVDLQSPFTNTIANKQPYVPTTEMPNQIPDFQISNFLSANTVPLPIYSLPNTSPLDQQCPICHNLYSDPPEDYVRPLFPPGFAEYAVQVRNRGLCEHIFGRRCIESHIRSGTPWSHTCPLCRAEWFPAPHGGRTELLRNFEGALNGLARLEVQDDNVRSEVERVERMLGRIREILYMSRWI